VTRTQNIVQVNFPLRRRKAGHPAACAFAPLCLPPPARPLPLQRPALLHAPPLARTCPRRSQLHMPPPELHPGPLFRDFRPLSPGPRLRPLPPPVQGSHMRGPLKKHIPGLNNARERSRVRPFIPRASTRLSKNACLSDTCFVFVLLTSNLPRSFYSAEYEILTVV